MKKLNGPQVLRSNQHGSLVKKLDDWLGSFFAGHLPIFAGCLLIKLE